MTERGAHKGAATPRKRASQKGKNNEQNNEQNTSKTTSKEAKPPPLGV
jgi:hypothetical protein